MEYLNSFDQVPKTTSEKDWDWYDIDELWEYIYGAPLKEQKTLAKLYNIEKILSESGDTESARKNFNAMNRSTAGIRLKFKTNSGKIALKAEVERKNPLVKLTQCSHSGFDIYAKNDNSDAYYHLTVIAPESNENIFFHEITVVKNTTIQIFFPLYNPVIHLKLGIDQGSNIENGQPYVNKDKPLIFYGNSVMQGASASRPGNAYPNIVSRTMNLDMLNYAFSAACFAEMEVVEQISNWDTVGLVLDYQYNARTPVELENNIERLYEHYRKKHTKTPIIVLDTYLSAAYNSVIAKFIKKHKHDNNLHSICLKDTFSKYDIRDISIDGTHYGDVGMYEIAQKIITILTQPH